MKRVSECVPVGEAVPSKRACVSEWCEICDDVVRERPERRAAFEGTLHAGNVLHAAYFLHKWVCGELEPVATAERLEAAVKKTYCQTCLNVLVPSEDWEKAHHEPAPGTEKRASFVKRLAMPGTLLRDSVLCAFYLLVLTRESEDAAPLLTRDAVKIPWAPPVVLHPFGRSPPSVELKGAVHDGLEVHYFLFADLQTEVPADFYARKFAVTFCGQPLCTVTGETSVESSTPFVAPRFNRHDERAVMYVHRTWTRDAKTGTINFTGEPERVYKRVKAIDYVVMLRAFDSLSGEVRWAPLHIGYHRDDDDWPLSGWRGPCVDLKTRLGVLECTGESVAFVTERADDAQSLSTVAVRLKDDAVVEYNGRDGPFNPHDRSVPAFARASQVNDMWNVLSPFYGARMTPLLKAPMVLGREVYVTLPVGTLDVPGDFAQ